VRLEVRNVDKRYGTRNVLKKTELTIEPGQFVAIVGRSGCGKSTLLRLVAGLESVSGGAIRLDGKDIAGLSSDTRIMFQDSRLLPWKRVADNVALGLPPERRGAARRPTCWPAWAWATAWASGRRACREASASAWPWPVRWCTTHACCCSMNPWARSMRSPASRCTA
jgi:ABC-type multidrug transport system fused ATPase/permease subunit